MATTESPAIINESIAIDAPIADVFAALTEPEQLTQWWGSENGYHTEKMEADLRPGGAWITTGTGAKGKFSVSGVYTIVEPPHVLAFTWQHDWKPTEDRDETLVRYDLTEANGITTVRITHSGFKDHADREDHARGWKIVLGWLRDYSTR